MTAQELKAGLPIRLEALHRDAQEQPHLACMAAEEAAERKAAARRAKLEYEEAVAKAQQAIRANPGMHGIDKVTEKAVEVAVALEPSIHEASQLLLAAELEAGRAEALANAYEHRRAMLKLEAELWMANYWGDVSVKERDMRPVADAAHEGRERKAVEGLRRHRIEE